MSHAAPIDVLTQAVRAKAVELGFDLVGIAPVGPSAYGDYFRRWLDQGRHGSMAYLARRVDERIDPSVYLPGARSAVCVAINYKPQLDAAGQPQTQPQSGRIARYALGDDYHEVIKPRLFELADFIRTARPDAQTRVGVDTAPILEKELAQRGGIGWIGKNTCLIHPRIGSWLLLGEVITTAELQPDEPGIDRCGTCTRCLDACPTGALDAPYQMDARRCISYLTIEHAGAIEPSLAAMLGDWVYGCDICQEVCPWNTKAPAGSDPALQPRTALASGSLDPAEVLSWDADRFAAVFRRSAVKRVKLPQLQRNARHVLENVSAKKGRTR